MKIIMQNVFYDTELYTLFNFQAHFNFQQWLKNEVR